MKRAQPSLAAQWPARVAQADHRGIGVTIINFNTSAQTLRCLESLEHSAEAPAWVLVLDNASRSDDFERLLTACCALRRSTLRLYRSEENLGFASGSNFLIGQLLAESSCRFVGLLNNDAVAQPAMVTRLVDALAAAPQRIGLAGGRMHKLHAPDQVDTLGITIYASLMPADRHSVDDPYIGPTGGCCLMTREFIEELITTSGYCFDDRFFCYCEDTDLVLRAALLGYQSAYVDEVVALHEGQASSGGGYNPFIAYHGIRNTIWMHMKLMPVPTLLRHGPLLVLAHLMTIVRHTAAGHIRLLASVYGDAWTQRRAFWAERRRFQPHIKLTPLQLSHLFAPRFYRKGYLRWVVAQLLNYHKKAPR